MNEIKFVKADGSETTIDSTIADFKASVKFTTDDLTNTEYVQLDEFTDETGAVSSMIVITLFAILGGKLSNENRLPVNIGFENFVDLMVTPREAGSTTIEALKYANTIPFKNSKSIKTKFKLISGTLPPGLDLPEEITGTKLGVDGTVFDSVDVFKDVWSINKGKQFTFNQESIFNSKVEFLNIQPTTGLFVGMGLQTATDHSRVVDAVSTYVDENDVTRTKISVPYMVGTVDSPSALHYAKNTVYDERGALTQSKDSNFLGQLKTTAGTYTYTDTSLPTDTSNIQDEITRDYNFVIGMYNGDTDALLAQESFSIRVRQNFDAVRDDFLRTSGLSGQKKYFPYLDVVSNYKLPLLKADGSSTFITMTDNKLKVDNTEIITTDGLLSLLLISGSASNITLQSV